MTGPDGSNTDSAGITRRRVLAGTLLFVGGSARLVDGRTTAAFSDDAATSDAVRIDGDPNLDYLIDDQTRNNNAAYEVAYQVEWVSNFDRIEIRIENIDAGHIGPETFTRYSTESVVDYPGGGGSDGGAGGDTYEFRFRVYRGGDASPVIDRTVTDVADGDGKREGEFRDPSDPTVERITVTDTTRNNNTTYSVEYGASNTNFSHARISFDNRSNDWSEETKTSSSKPTGTVTYSQGGTGGDTYDITVSLVDDNGLTVASHTVTDVADGNDSEWTA